MPGVVAVDRQSRGGPGAVLTDAISRTGPDPERQPQPSILRTFITNLQNRAFGKKADAAVEQEPEPAYDDDTPRLG